ncbi:hypothetical protein GYN07_18635 [Rhizobium leguminosarum bv. viciae 248]|uniref:hypothetical protein n=1 Tax=Rhizobium leguminosarum TaxID=384 RepID=UPI00139852D3|nr:hypothetical protein [Rhizobium leguminosarum]MCA2411796.1 hypothetical protein [Rhizobium leguminosarum]QHW22801.1 hypothetical protein GYN07_18635 [Rhizobium leguminosarum bv. viciae 248]
MLRTVDYCRPDLFAAMVLATPDDSTCVVETDRQRRSAKATVTMRFQPSDKTHGWVNKYLSVRSPGTKFGYRHARTES